MKRQALLGIAKALVGDEAIGQERDDGSSFVECLSDAGIMAGRPPNASGAAQQALLHRAHCNRAALRGAYTVEMERP